MDLYIVEKRSVVVQSPSKISEPTIYEPSEDDLSGQRWWIVLSCLTRMKPSGIAISPYCTHLNLGLRISINAKRFSNPPHLITVESLISRGFLNHRQYTKSAQPA